ncbi:MAG: tRNA-uridine aminocarboxypropyltransferase [Bdellovibrionota bacterium]
MRPLCPRCLKSLITCYCGRLQPFRTNLMLILLQHPLERKKAIGTARMTHLSIPGSRLICGKEFTQDREVNALIEDSGNHCVVLFPGPSAHHLCDQRGAPATSWYPPEKRLVIFVIDGTWMCAKRMIRMSPNLAALPRISFDSDRLSEYRIRKQPEPHCLSTIEAVYRILELLDPDADREALLDVFRSMVNQQVEFEEARSGILR